MLTFLSKLAFKLNVHVLYIISTGFRDKVRENEPSEETTLPFDDNSAVQLSLFWFKLYRITT